MQVAAFWLWSKKDRGILARQLARTLTVEKASRLSGTETGIFPSSLKSSEIQASWTQAVFCTNNFELPTRPKIP